MAVFHEFWLVKRYFQVGNVVFDMGKVYLHVGKVIFQMGKDGFHVGEVCFHVARFTWPLPAKSSSRYAPSG